MATFSWDELIEATGGALVTVQQPLAQPVRLWSDTRTLAPHDFFIPLSGANFNGHDYLEKAFQQGAVGAFIAESQWHARHEAWQSLPNLVVVPDPLQAYMTMAKYHREKIDPIVIGLTGSSGKTSTKEMLFAAFSGIDKTQKTEKNFNNEIGVSQTLLALEPQTQLSIVEMGMRGLHQIDMLSEIALPDIALITNVGPAHIGLLGSLENIALAKLEITTGLDPEKGLLVINGDDELLCRKAAELWQGRTVRFTLADAKTIRPWFEDRNEGVQFEYHHHTIKLPVPGEHQVSNALAVLKVGEALGFTIEDMVTGLSGYRPEAGRWALEPLPGYQDVMVINDAYNANPDSLMASLKTFLADTRLDRKRVLILGGMKELGEFSEQYHREIGRWLAGQQMLDALFTIGEEGDWIAEEAKQQETYPVYAFQTAEETVSKLIDLHQSAALSLREAVICIKGSRAYNLDGIPARLSEVRKQQQQQEVG